MTDRIYTAEELQDLTDRVYLLKAQLEEGKIHVAAHLAEDFKESIAAIRISPSGLVDPDTVDGRIRSFTLVLKAFKYRQELKDAYSIADVQEMYFKILDAQFGKIFESMIKVGGTPAQAGEFFSRDKKFVEHASKTLPELAEEVRLFWAEVAEIGEIHLQDGMQLKASFSGDIFPGHWGERGFYGWSLHRHDSASMPHHTSKYNFENLAWPD